MSNLEKEFVPYQESLELKELGFDEPCFGLWNINNGKYEADIIGICKYSKDFKYREVLAPTFSQCFKWFREKYDLVHRIDRDGGWWICAILNLYDEKDQGAIEIYLEDCYPNSYEEAELACLIKLIEIVKEKQ